MYSFIVISTKDLRDLQYRASELIDKGYIPAGGITQVPYSYKFYIDEANALRDSDSITHIQFLQSFYKPPTNSI